MNVGGVEKVKCERDKQEANVLQRKHGWIISLPKNLGERNVGENLHFHMILSPSKLHVATMVRT